MGLAPLWRSVQMKRQSGDLAGSGQGIDRYEDELFKIKDDETKIGKGQGTQLNLGRSCESDSYRRLYASASGIKIETRDDMVEDSRDR